MVTRGVNEMRLAKRIKNLIGVLGAVALLGLGALIPSMANFSLEAGVLACFVLVLS